MRPAFHRSDATRRISNRRIEVRKPIIDRVVTRSTSLATGGPVRVDYHDSIDPLESVGGTTAGIFCAFKSDTLRSASLLNIDTDMPISMIRTRWSESLRHAFHALPDPEWLRQS